jgi:hypothetical protein
VSIVLAVIIGRRHGFKATILALTILSVGFVVVEMSDVRIEESVIVGAFTSSVEEVSEETGTWETRLEKIKIDFEEFLKHPVIGGGLLALRDTPSMRRSPIKWNLVKRSRMEDLGYTHWLKAFGVIGMIWLLLFFYFLWSGGRKILHGSDDIGRSIARFSLSYIGFVFISFVTLNHFMFSQRIFFVCLVSAIIVRLIWNDRGRTRELHKENLKLRFSPQMEHL